MRPYGRGTVPCSKRGIQQISGLNKEGQLITVLIVELVLKMLGSLPTWPHSSGWGYYPSGGLGLILLILIVLALSGRL